VTELTGGSPPVTVSAVVVNYRAVDHLLTCLASLKADGVGSVVVVDNNSGDDAAARLGREPGISFIGMERNVGYGAAVNRGMQECTTEAVIVCNPDVVIGAGATRALLAALDGSERIAAVGPQIQRPDGTRYPSARAFPSIVDAAGHGFLGLVSTDNPFSRRYLRTDADQAGPVDWVSGACLMVRRDAFGAVGGFDESFFMFMEDVDLCWRLRQRGWDIVYEPAATVTHVEGVSRQSAPYRMIVAHHRSLMRFGWRTTTGRRRWWLPVVAVGLVVRTAVLSAREFLRTNRRRRPR
jgi:N-acetylglucosaminyl-diphospho-decaprenol L-rhamnosyltransferase